MAREICNHRKNVEETFLLVTSAVVVTDLAAGVVRGNILVGNAPPLLCARCPSRRRLLGDRRPKRPTGRCSAPLYPNCDYSSRPAREGSHHVPSAKRRCWRRPFVVLGGFFRVWHVKHEHQTRRRPIFKHRVTYCCDTSRRLKVN